MNVWKMRPALILNASMEMVVSSVGHAFQDSVELMILTPLQVAVSNFNFLPNDHLMLWEIAVCDNGDIRLSNGNGSSGRVEVCYQNSYGSVCVDRWDERDALVVCRQLNSSYSSEC